MRFTLLILQAGKKEVLPLYMIILSSNEDTKHLNMCHISIDFNEKNLYNKQTFFF